MNDSSSDRYAGLTAEQLEVQYNNRARVPEHPALIDAWRDRSASFRETARMRADIVCGEHERERIDLFLPEGVGPFPVHAYLHGGYWQLLGREWFSFLARPFVDAGVAFAAMGYPLCPDVRVGDIVASVRSSMAWLWNEAPSLDLDRERIQVSGHSAGGHLAAMLLATDWEDFGISGPQGPVHSVLAISGVFELEPVVYTSHNSALGLDINAARRSSPTLLAPACDVPLTVAVGGLESEEFLRQSRDFVESWSASGMDLDYIEVPEANHFTVLEAMVDPSGLLARRALDYLNR